MKVLIVDDIEANRYLLRTLLQVREYQVTEAANGREALSEAHRDPPDLIVSDILMPIMDGFALCHEWKQDDRLKDIPFVFYTATYTDDKDKALALGLGADAYYIKPMEGHEFLREIVKVIEAKASGHAPAHQPTIEGDEPYYREYNACLVHKLEEKMQELEQSNKALRELNNDLENRVAERTADLSDLNEELESFAYSVSHDLRTPLRAINGFSFFLEKEYGEQLDEIGRDYLGRIRHGSLQMSRLIDDLLTLSRVSRRDLSRVQVDLSHLAETVFQGISETAPERRVSFSVQPGLRTLADEGLMAVLLENLIGNAWKFTRNTPEADIQFGQIEFDDKPAFYLRDNGTGFDMRYADKLFSPFQRLHSDKEFEGTGIGLATVKRIVRRHGGRIWANATPGRGTTLYFILEGN